MKPSMVYESGHIEGSWSHADAPITDDIGKTLVEYDP